MLVLFSLASKHSPLHLREVVRSCLQSWEPLLLDVASSCQSVWGYTYSLRPVQPEGHKKLKSIAFVRDFEHFDNEIDLAGLKGWEDMEVVSVKPQEFVSSLPLVTA